MNENKILDKLSCLGWDLQEELNGDVEKYKQARVEMDRIESAQAELWLRLVGKRRELDRIDRRLDQAGCVGSKFFYEHPHFTHEMREALGKSGIEGFGPTKAGQAVCAQRGPALRRGSRLRYAGRHGRVAACHGEFADLQRAGGCADERRRLPSAAVRARARGASAGREGTGRHSPANADERAWPATDEAGRALRARRSGRVPRMAATAARRRRRAPNRGSAAGAVCAAVKEK